MKKQKWVHLHGLLEQVRRHYEQESGERLESNSYIYIGARPTSIHKSKTDHKEAVFALADGLIQEMNEPGSTSYNFESYFEELAEKSVESGVEFETYPASSEENPEFGSYHILSSEDVDLNYMILEELDQSGECGVSYHTLTGRITVPDTIVEEYLEESDAEPVRI